MSVPDPHKAWMLFMSDPVDFILMFVAVAVVVGGGIWFLRGQIDKGQLATLKERVNLAKEEQGGLEKQVEALKRETASQQALIKELDSDVTPAKLYNLSASSMRIVRTVNAVSNTTASIGTTLTISGGMLRLMVVEPDDGK